MQDQEDKVVEGLFQSLLSRYKMSGRHWWKVAILSLIVFIYYITSLKVNPNRIGSNKDSPDLIKKKCNKKPHP